MTTKNAARASEAREQIAMRSTVVPPQMVAVTLLTLLALAAGILVGAFGDDFTMSRSSMRTGSTNGLIIPPGMIMTNDMTDEQMRDMAAVDPKYVSYTAPADARGDHPLAPQLVDGVKVFSLDVSVIRWNILPVKQVLAYACNRQVPGPRIQITQGDRVRFVVKNNLPEAT